MGFSRVQTRELTNAPCLYGVVNGTATANKALVLDANKAISTITTLTATNIVATNITASNMVPVAPLAAGASATVTSASPSTVLLNTAAGSVVTLPAATGSGKLFRFIVTTTTTSGAHKILAASSSDFMNGIAVGFTGSTAKVFASAAATNHSIQMPFAGTQPSGGFIGDWFEVIDVATNLWNVEAHYQAGTTPTTPFSAATS